MSLSIAHKLNATGSLTLASSSFSSPGAETLTTVPNSISSTATLTGLTIVPSTAQMTTSALGKQYQFTLEGTFSDGSTGFLTGSATWSSSNQNVATVVAGLATSTGYGQTTITAALNGVSATATLDIVAAVPVISWQAPSSITYGTALSGVQLNATASAPGTFTYSPAAGTVLTAGTHTLSVTFTPTNADYATVTGSVSIVVAQATPTISWATPSSITYGTALSGAQLNATASIPGTFAYSPAAGAVLTAGNNTLSVTFTPTDAVDYTMATATVSLVATNPVPNLNGLSPAYVNRGRAAFTLKVTGTGSQAIRQSTGEHRHLLRNM